MVNAVGVASMRKSRRGAAVAAKSKALAGGVHVFTTKENPPPWSTVNGQVRQ